MFLFKQRQDEDDVVIVDAAATERVESQVAALRAERPSRRIVVLAAKPTWQGARAAFDAGAIDYLPKDLGDEELRRRVEDIRRRSLLPWRAEIN